MHEACGLKLFRGWPFEADVAHNVSNNWLPRRVIYTASSTCLHVRVLLLLHTV
jgi:hypothetical protein